MNLKHALNILFEIDLPAKFGKNRLVIKLFGMIQTLKGATKSRVSLKAAHSRSVETS